MLNATLIIQIVHFFFAYLLIDKFFLRNALKMLQEEDAQKTELMNQIEHLDAYINKLQKEKDYQWQLFKHAFNERKPKVMETEALIMQAHIPANIPLELQQKDIQKLVDIITERMSYGPHT